MIQTFILLNPIYYQALERGMQMDQKIMLVVKDRQVAFGVIIGGKLES
jgi:hypothetical protein